MVATALREAREELGVNVATDSVWGTLKPLRDWVSALVTVLIYLYLIYNFNVKHFWRTFTVSLTYRRRIFDFSYYLTGFLLLSVSFSPVRDDDCSSPG